MPSDHVAHMREVVGSSPTATTIPDTVKNPSASRPIGDFGGLAATSYTDEQI